VCRRGADERAGRGVGGDDAGLPRARGGGGRGIPVARGRAPARSWSRVDGNAPPPLAPPRAPGRSRRGACGRGDPEKDPRRRALPGSTLASARRAPKAAARRAGAGAGSAAARSRSAAGRSGANERAPRSDLARALVTEPVRGAGRRRKAGRVGAAGRGRAGRVRARDAPLGLLGELGLVHEVRAGQAGQILGGGHRAHGGRGGARERERCASGMWADGRATEPSSSSRTVERAPVKAFSG
jgi:hypothetical protein